MKKQEILRWIECEIQSYPERATGNECENFIIQLVGRLILSDRIEFIAAMQYWIRKHDKRTLLAIQIVAKYKLRELTSEIEYLLVKVRTGKVFHPYYEEFIIPALEQLAKDP